MGEGKTYTLIERLKKQDEYYQDDGKRFLVCVPRITEQERIQKSVECSIPLKGYKIENTKKLIREGRNICCTHSLFDMFDDEIFTLFNDGVFKYDLYYDEQPQFYKGVIGGTRKNNHFQDDFIDNINYRDLGMLINQGDLISVKNKYVWNPEKNISDSAKGIFKPLYNLSKTTDFFPYGENKILKHLPNSLVVLTSPRCFSCFDNVWVLSYLLKGSLVENYLTLHKDIFTYEYYHVEDGMFVQGYKFKYPDGIGRISINDWKTDLCMDYKLSKSGYKNLSEDEIRGLANCFYNYMRTKKAKLKIEDYIFTSYTEYEKVFHKYNKNISNKRFLACNTKAVNDFNSATLVGYLIDRYMNPILVNFFKSQSIRVDEELFALSEMIQFIWRANVRCKGSSNTVHVFIPSERMKMIFIDWRNQCSLYKKVA